MPKPPRRAVTSRDAEVGFVVMSRQVLDSPLGDADTAGLGKAEWLQIDSWRPTSVGKTVFNSWN